MILGAQPFHRDNMVGCNQINNSLNIIISNMLTLLLFNKEHHNFFSNHSSYNTFLTIILFIFTFNLLFISMPTISSYVTIFPTIKAFYSILKPRFKSWLWPIIEFNPIIRPYFYLCSYSLWKSLILCVIYMQTSSLKIKSWISLYLNLVFPTELLTIILMASNCLAKKSKQSLHKSHHQNQFLHRIIDLWSY